MRDSLIQMKPGMYMNRNDPRFEEKMWRYGIRQPRSEVHKAELLLQSGQAQEAKTIYRSLLKHHQTYEIHQKLAALCTVTEALQSARSSQSRQLKSLYYQRVLQLDANNREARGYFASPFRKSIPWLLVLLFAFLLIALCGWLIKTKIAVEQLASITIHTDHQVHYLDQMPSNLHLNGTIPLNDERNLQAILNRIDQSDLQPNQIDSLMDASQNVIGLVRYNGDGHYDISLLNHSFASVGADKSAADSQPNPLQLNLIRTAYDYYLHEHNDVPPTSADELSAYLPDGISLSQIQFHSNRDVRQAIRPADGTDVPFEKPILTVNTQRHELKLKYGTEILVESVTGVGRQDQPTPNGTFTVTGRMKNNLSPVYGAYIFPLNNSNFAIHGTNDPKRIGQADSIGCVEVPNDIAEKLYQLVPVGTEVKITDQPDDSPAKLTWFR